MQRPQGMPTGRVQGAPAPGSRRCRSSAAYFLRGATDTVSAARNTAADSTGATGAGAFLGFFISLLPR